MNEWKVVNKDKLPPIGTLMAAIRIEYPGFCWTGKFAGIPNEDEDMFTLWIELSDWVFPNDDDPSTFWPRDKRVLCVDEQGWILIVMATEKGFELDDGSEPGLWPIAWKPLPEPPK